MNLRERQQGVEFRIGITHTKEKRRGSLDPDRIGDCLGGSVEKLKPVPVCDVDTREVVGIVERWKISIVNKDLGFVTDIYINPQTREVSIFRQKEGSSSNPGELKLPFPNQEESYVRIRKVNQVKYYENRIKFVKRGRGSTGGIDVLKSGKVELKGDPRLFLSGRKRSENVDYFIDLRDFQ